MPGSPLAFGQSADSLAITDSPGDHAAVPDVALPALYASCDALAEEIIWTLPALGATVEERKDAVLLLCPGVVEGLLQRSALDPSFKAIFSRDLTKVGLLLEQVMARQNEQSLREESETAALARLAAGYGKNAAAARLDEIGQAKAERRKELNGIYLELRDSVTELQSGIRLEKATNGQAVTALTLLRSLTAALGDNSRSSMTEARTIFSHDVAAQLSSADRRVVVALRRVTDAGGELMEEFFDATRAFLSSCQGFVARLERLRRHLAAHLSARLLAALLGGDKSDAAEISLRGLSFPGALPGWSVAADGKSEPAWNVHALKTSFYKKSESVQFVFLEQVFPMLFHSLFPGEREMRIAERHGVAQMIDEYERRSGRRAVLPAEGYVPLEVLLYLLRSPALATFATEENRTTRSI